MGWFTSFFAFDTSQRSRQGNGQVFNSTNDAFSLPTSPVLTSHPDAFNPDALNTPDPESNRTRSSYTYPPPGTVAYGYVPSSGFNSRQASSSLLPTHMDPLHTNLLPNPPYPPLSHTWTRVRSWLSREYPELGDTLNYGILPLDLSDVENQFGFALPAVVRESYLCVDGQEAESAAGCSEGLFFGLTLLPLETVLEEWRFWREVDEDPSTGSNIRLREAMQSIPPGWVRKSYSQRGWIPLIADKAGNYVGVDLNPGESGSVGQVIVFGRDFDTKVVLWKGDGPTGWAKWLASFVEELEIGEGFEIGGNEASEGSEDDVGYESYYYDGSGRGQGDGGGDAGSGGGLRYTGEYRGWNVLEAWADRSLRKWHEAGVISDAALMSGEESVKNKPDEQLDLDISEISPQGPSSEIPIPIMNDSTEDIPSPIVGAMKKHSTVKQHSLAKPSTSKRQSPPSNLPTIAVTKPPAPLPVKLPTALDIVPSPSPPDSKHSSLEDLESGRINGMREVAEDIGLVTSTRKTGKAPLRHDSADATGSAIPIPIPSIPPPLISPITSPRATPTTFPPNSPFLRDLLADSVPGMDKEPIEPSPVTPEATHPPLELDTSSDDLKVDTTIRLVGGGGQAGVAENPVISSLEEEGPPLTEVVKDAQVATINSSEAGSKSNEKSHKKSKSSLVSLKKIGQLGRTIKRDSVSSVKEMISPR